MYGPDLVSFVSRTKLDHDDAKSRNMFWNQSHTRSKVLVILILTLFGYLLPCPEVIYGREAYYISPNEFCESETERNCNAKDAPDSCLERESFCNRCRPCEDSINLEASTNFETSIFGNAILKRLKLCVEGSNEAHAKEARELNQIRQKKRNTSDLYDRIHKSEKCNTQLRNDIERIVANERYGYFDNPALRTLHRPERGNQSSLKRVVKKDLENSNKFYSNWNDIDFLLRLFVALFSLWHLAHSVIDVYYNSKDIYTIIFAVSFFRKLFITITIRHCLLQYLNALLMTQSENEKTKFSLVVVDVHKADLESTALQEKYVSVSLASSSTPEYDASVSLESTDESGIHVTDSDRGSNTSRNDVNVSLQHKGVQHKGAIPVITKDICQEDPNGAVWKHEDSELLCCAVKSSTYVDDSEKVLHADGEDILGKVVETCVKEEGNNVPTSDCIVDDLQQECCDILTNSITGKQNLTVSGSDFDLKNKSLLHTKLLTLTNKDEVKSKQDADKFSHFNLVYMNQSQTNMETLKKYCPRTVYWYSLHNESTKAKRNGHMPYIKNQVFKRKHLDPKKDVLKSKFPHNHAEFSLSLNSTEHIQNGTDSGRVPEEEYEEFCNIRSQNPVSQNVASVESNSTNNVDELPKLSKSTDCKKEDISHECKLLLNCWDYSTSKEDTQKYKPHGHSNHCSFYKNILKSSYPNEKGAWLLEKHLKVQHNLPTVHDDYRTFSREWHRKSVPERRYHVFTLFTLHEKVETFKYWPSDAPVSKTDLIEAGFLYKGDGFDVMCDSCGFTKSNWKPEDVPLQIHKMEKPDCEYLLTTFPDLKVTGGYNTVDSATSVPFSNNQSILNQFGSMSISSPSLQSTVFSPQPFSGGHFQQQPLSFASNIGQPATDSLPTTSQSRFPEGATALYTNDSLRIAGIAPKHPEFASIQSRLRSFSSWTIGHIQQPANIIHAGFYYTGSEDIVRCYFCDIGLAEWDREDDPWAEHARHSPDCEYLKKERGHDFIEGIQSSWRQVYCPRHPEYSDFHIRLGTYGNWPSYLHQQPQNLAEAGFFYAGEEDVVRCHYCDGGLRQWEADDDPWTEHARWFPYCKYIVKIKGTAFIEGVARQYSEIYQGSTTDPSTLEITNEQSGLSSEHHRGPLSPEVIDTIIEMGYSRRQINMAFHYYIQMTGRRNPTADEITNILLENNFASLPSINNEPSTAAKEVTCKTTSDIENLEPRKLLDLNQQLKQQLMCNICKEKESIIVFNPCGHRITCDGCSQSLDICPTCGEKIKTKIKTYLA